MILRKELTFIHWCHRQNNETVSTKKISRAMHGSGAFLQQLNGKLQVGSMTPCY